jgi:N-acetylmuramoyl-L-alanine amidase/Fibronectin type III domain
MITAGAALSTATNAAAGGNVVAATPDYGGATWIPTSPANYSVADRPHDYPVQLIVIHDTEGSYSSAISEFQDPSRQASAHYVVSKTGQIAQMVQEKDIAWHAGNWDYNTRAIGIEHEGYAWTPGTYTIPEYQASAHIAASICSRWGVPMDRTHVIGHSEVPDPNNPNLFGGSDHHTDPGPYWNWSYYMSLAQSYASTLKSPPHMMTDPVAVNGLTSATVTWRPAQSCHTPITGYTVVAQPGGITQTLPATATSATFDNLQPGTTYTLTVTATDADGQDSLAANPVTPGRCNNVTLSSSPSAPQVTGTIVHFSAGSMSCANPLYQFWSLAPGSSTWTVEQTYSTSTAFTWDSTAKLGGMWQFEVWARDANSAGNASTAQGAYDDLAWTQYGITPRPCTSVNVSAAPPSPAGAGTAVTLTASAAGCPNARYSFWTRAASSSVWKMVQDYSASNTYQWSSRGSSGTVYLSAWARDLSSPGTFASPGLGTFDSNRTIAYNVTAPRCTGAHIAATPGSPQTSGTQVTLTATASGCVNSSPLFAFWMRPASSSTWTLVRGYSATNTFTWDTSRISGSVYFSVWAKDASSPTTGFDANASTLYSVNAASCASVTMTATPASPSAHGTQVTFTAGAAGCSNANPQFEFWILSGSTWRVVRGWSANATWTWDTTGLAPGTYHFGVWARDAASTGIHDGGGMGRYDAFAGQAYTLS